MLMFATSKNRNACVDRAEYRPITAGQACKAVMRNYNLGKVGYGRFNAEQNALNVSHKLIYFILKVGKNS